MLVNVNQRSNHVWIHRPLFERGHGKPISPFGLKEGAGIKAQHNEALKLAAGFGECPGEDGRRCGLKSNVFAKKENLRS